ncbi:MAG: DUF5615 family PIN-like protein [Candidatus Kuenenia sp.]|nr:DUF5615 family PIN-like protein [Candidatus Kuenenia sp.]
MKFPGDMGISQAAIKWLNEQGLDAIHVRNINMCRSSDTEILLKAKKDG